jgi:hypothetical protein
MLNEKNDKVQINNPSTPLRINVKPACHRYAQALRAGQVQSSNAKCQKKNWDFEI